MTVQSDSLHENKITGIIITLNEQYNIQECIKSLQLVCDEILVVDSGSVDETQGLAEAAGARVIKQPYLGDGPQKNFGVPFAKNDWILSLDADERLLPETAEKIKTLNLQNTQIDAFAFRRRNFIGSRWIKCAGWYPDYCVRLFNKNKARFEDIPAHSFVRGENVEKLTVDIIHHSYKEIGELFVKGDRFSSRGAKMLYRRGRRSNVASASIHGLAAFFKIFILKGGIFGGLDGWSISLSAGTSSFLKYAKLVEIHKEQGNGIEKKVEGIW